MSTAPERRILTVSQLNRSARQLLETHFNLLWVEGEISNFARPASGHCYFTLKDQGAQIRCAMFRNRAQGLRIRPGNGLKVLIRGRVSLYEDRGDYQLIVEHMEDAGLGALQQAFDALKAKLMAEGLFDAARKRPLPYPVQHLAIITSATGAALRDVLAVFERRWPLQQATVIPVPVQGAESAPAIVRAFELAHRANRFDAILLTRGGGSLEDLWSFNEESVARAIAASRIPVICGVGHETDTTIADYVADLRAPTPSAAAELITPDGDEMLETFAGYEVMLEEAIARKLERSQERTRFLAHRLNRARPSLGQLAQRLDFAQQALVRQWQQQWRVKRHQCQLLQQRLAAQHPRQQLQWQRERLQQLRARLLRQTPVGLIQQHQQTLSREQKGLQRIWQQTLSGQQQQLKQLMQALHNLSPLQTLERGFAIVTNAKGQALMDANQVKPGDTIQARLHKGKITATVK
ncbi:exodeoxyribonuclease VII large subunit [Simiduia agarivorans]|uniref:Exodeoxyribonuclease 7 large subunit n=1 Tax=Simiduia agarivorans (strain DSM 21679 / JCM 13881 / BCRC 17597 / SA1) TaxID=1117647 RepID=K4KS35_SIMAS|nr:exodeoxyribonuclease VII large subunit [Simiduia agarivorans]AFV00979.1 exodeoxyribonuclease VII large subunit [Simiduia agarivorans SA1 = DSM 21679]